MRMVSTTSYSLGQRPKYIAIDLLSRYKRETT